MIVNFLRIPELIALQVCAIINFSKKSQYDSSTQIFVCKIKIPIVTSNLYWINYLLTTKILIMTSVLVTNWIKIAELCVHRWIERRQAQCHPGQSRTDCEAKRSGDFLKMMIKKAADPRDERVDDSGVQYDLDLRTPLTKNVARQTADSSPSPHSQTATLTKNIFSFLSADDPISVIRISVVESLPGPAAYVENIPMGILF